MQPVKSLFQSRKFWTLMLDVVISLLVYFVTKYADPSYAEDALFVIAALQPVFLSMIIGTALEDAAAKRSGNFPHPPVA